MTNPRYLSGGARRRHRLPRGFLVAVMLGVAVIAAVVLLAPGTDDGHPGTKASPAPVAAADPAVRALRASGGAGKPRDDALLFAVDLTQPDTVRLRFGHQPRAGLLFDVKTGRVLWRHNPTRRLPIASLTKMMSALIVVERDDPHDRVRISKRAVTTPGSAVGVLPKGKRVQLEALMNGLLLVSGNDTAVALAEHTAGSVRAFVRAMNRRAKEMFLSCTHFTTPHGLEDRGNRSCAADLGTIARADLARGRIRRIVRRSEAILKFPIKGGRLFLYNNNPLIRAGYPGTTGLKTGYTDRAGRSLVATVRRGKIELGVVLLHSIDPATQAKKLFKRGFRAMRRG
jgi:D-alanyl-D-alanine carboxypeptidase (penicillin-binding protein 5/6)